MSSASGRQDFVEVEKLLRDRWNRDTATPVSGTQRVQAVLVTMGKTRASETASPHCRLARLVRRRVVSGKVRAGTEIPGVGCVGAMYTTLHSDHQ